MLASSADDSISPMASGDGAGASYDAWTLRTPSLTNSAGMVGPHQGAFSPPSYDRHYHMGLYAGRRLVASELKPQFRIKLCLVPLDNATHWISSKIKWERQWMLIET